MTLYPGRDNLEKWVRYTLWLTAPFNFIAAFAFSFPTSALGTFLELPQQAFNFYTLFTGAMVGLFGFMYAWTALQPTINQPILTLGAIGKTIAVVISATLFVLDRFSGFALFIMAGDLLFAGFWFYWLASSRFLRV